ncbi:MAG: methyltransferase domain-containing protein [Candidatus Falkowbacteria bacterium]|nr:methyltransferase domain-containing protein [Candidatus Falkowbacteria bacterium]
MNSTEKIFNLISETLAGKTLYRILFDWTVAEYCQGLSGVCVDLASGGGGSYQRYWQISPERMIKVDIDKANQPDLVSDLNNDIALPDKTADNVFFFNSFYLLKDRTHLLKEIKRILKDNGQAFLTAEFIKSEEKGVTDYERFTARNLEILLSPLELAEYKIIPIGERFTATANLREFVLGNFLLSRIAKLFYRPWNIILDKTIPHKIKSDYPCPIAWFIIIRK